MEKKQFIHALQQAKKEAFAFSCNDFDVIISVGVLPSRHDEALLHALQNTHAKLVYLFSMEEASLIEKSAFFSRYEVGSEEGVFALLAKSFLLHVKMPHMIETYFEELDEGYLSAESNVGEEEIEVIEALYQEANKVLLLLGDDILSHPRASHIAKLAGLIARYGKAHVMVVGATEADISLNDSLEMMDEVADIKSFDGVVVYECPLRAGEKEGLLIGSTQFQMAAKVKENESIGVKIGEEVHACTFVKDETLKGVIGLMPCAKLSGAYPYHVVKIVK